MSMPTNFGSGQTPTFGVPTSTPVSEPEETVNHILDAEEPQEAEQVPSEEPQVEDLGGRYSRAAEFSRSDMVAAISFSQRWNAAPARHRELFSEMFDVYGNQAEIMFGLYPSNGRLSGLEFINSVRNMGTDPEKPLTPREMITMGMEFSSTIGDMDPENLRAITKMINAVTPEDYPEIRYRRNMPSSAVSNLILDGATAIEGDMSEFIDWSLEMLEIWPGLVQ